MAPLLRVLKSNVDASVQGSIGRTGIGSLRQNNEGNKLIMFSKSIDMSDPTGVEIVALLEALLAVATFPLPQKFRFYVARPSAIALAKYSRFK
ncbi:hypothetical protein V6N12_067909 [Hibiscus sabdariffa]|uniref:RNase H type-1 domain-containing protein n=1 Tax=Hibiscus sabdariffa TaxID=183260 RepID=A0ABR2FNF4_9ROSI